MFGTMRDDTCEYNKRSSNTHIAEANIELNEELFETNNTEYVSHFCFPLDFQFLVKEK